MSHFAKIENGLVTQVIVAEQDFIDTLEDKDSWVQTSYNTFANEHRLGGTPFRGNFAIVGGTYDAVNDVFIPPQPFPSWTLNNETFQWEAPVVHPSIADPNTPMPNFIWHEEKGAWEPDETIEFYPEWAAANGY